MVYNRFRANLLLRVGLLIISIAGITLVLYRTEWYMTAVCIGLLLLFQLYDLVHYVERTNRDISSFLEAIQHSDFTQHFAVKGGNPAYKELYQSFNDVTDAFQRIKTDKQAHHLYLQAIVEHIGVGIVSFDESGRVELVNHVLKEVLHTPHLEHIESLGRISEELVEVMRSIGHNERRLVTLQVRDEQLQLALHATILFSQGRTLKIVSCQNIKSELEEQELQTWQKLIRVLTHEIMNTITPVISLTATVSQLMEEEVVRKADVGEIPEQEVLEDIQTGLQTIEKRSTGMLHFVKNYRRLMRVPTPELRTVKVKDLLKSVQTLLQPEMEARQTKLSIYLREEKAELQIDPELIEQVLINLIKNGMEASHKAAGPCVEVIAYQEEQDRNRFRIDVQDNGTGIAPEDLDKIFIPFFTTKKQGSGIGLSLSRQIMRQHGGSIRVSSPPGGPTTFSLIFHINDE
ncbi:sensor histidine kinase [Pontibacter lucknowensis]|uniref:histidine kinase n=1 Tax=Pontibacter lucknowensis TaxID=1077936 RepID=A0A1N6YD69_9BACT|nr:ATP-binding protein [Pontibacter lucknowensis]SIR12446.1 Histidine kinase-, DNA gyrase B-, and HSP90-like ATPase [Pontibacter lucknowensis]